ncbi:hypothetical protein IW261DRAFT_90855 [Armillaria novae-zelandiae]|uniref:Secreted protein n=1 Tax=Armillaria novae-zelandiae TaxID=153914 RepID=A0AA39UJ40_9AGAR|nr:hypothetical protein IW261DRAFT_90855 [Armillaria novae-zelandiae]
MSGLNGVCLYPFLLPFSSCYTVTLLSSSQRYVASRISSIAHPGRGILWFLSQFTDERFFLDAILPLTVFVRGGTPLFLNKLPLYLVIRGSIKIRLPWTAVLDATTLPPSRSLAPSFLR